VTASSLAGNSHCRGLERRLAQQTQQTASSSGREHHPPIHVRPVPVALRPVARLCTYMPTSIFLHASRPPAWLPSTCCCIYAWPACDGQMKRKTTTSRDDMKKTTPKAAITCTRVESARYCQSRRRRRRQLGQYHRQKTRVTCSTPCLACLPCHVTVFDAAARGALFCVRGADVGITSTAHPQTLTPRPPSSFSLNLNLNFMTLYLHVHLHTYIHTRHALICHHPPNSQDAQCALAPPHPEERKTNRYNTPEK
jgi:hypothetical protein